MLLEIAAEHIIAPGERESGGFVMTIGGQIDGRMLQRTLSVKLALEFEHALLQGRQS